jgi:outer membrane lipoprotein SlyB
MSPRDFSAPVELAYGGGISGFAVAMHYLNDYVTPIATAVGAVAGAAVGLHALYRMVRPKNKRFTDRRN